MILEGSTSPLLLDRYIILDAIGSEGMGLVFKALHRSMERIVAIKVLPQYAVDSAEKVKRFRREVKAAAKFSHPNIVTAFDAHERNGTYFLVMEYVDGLNLGEYVRKHGPFSVENAIRVIDQVAAGLGAAHHGGLVHRGREADEHHGWPPTETRSYWISVWPARCSLRNNPPKLT